VRALKFAQVGATSRWGLAAVEELLGARPDIVTVEFASNDAALHRRISAAESLKNMTRIVRRLQTADSRPRIYLMTMSPAKGLRGLVRPRLDQYFQMYVGIAKREGVGLIDHRPSWRALPRSLLNQAIPDGAHPIPAYSLSITLVNVVKAIRRDLGC
jgi:hypothetical protein